MWQGTGQILVNNRPIYTYFSNPLHLSHAFKSLDITHTNGQFDIFIKVKGGGISGQAQAISHGIAHALLRWDGRYFKALHEGDCVERDERVVERKKPGQKGARKKFQWVKR